jgi:hypothetical protein
MSTKKILLIYAAIVVLGVLAVFKFGINPKPLDKIQLSEFENTTVIVNSMLMSIRQEMRQTPILIFGIDPKEPAHTEILMKFLEMNQEEGSKYQAVVMDQSILPPPGLIAETFSIVQEKERFMSGVQTALDQKIRLLVVVPHITAASILPAGVSVALKQKYQEPVFTTISLSNFPRSREQEPALSIPCNTGEDDLSQTSRVGCLILQKARAIYRKKMKSGANIGFMIQVGNTDFVFPLTKEL